MLRRVRIENSSSPTARCSSRSPAPLEPGIGNSGAAPSGHRFGAGRPSLIDGCYREDRLDRRRYDTYLTGTAGDFDDVVLWNREGEVTETTRANLLVEIDARWWTPPIDCGLLPGIGRAVLLEQGAVAERVMTLADLASATRVGVVSSLRGRRSAVLAVTPSGSAVVGFGGAR